MAAVDAQASDGQLVLGEINDSADLARNLAENAVPQRLREVTAGSYREFLVERRRLMASLMHRYYESL